MYPLDRRRIAIHAYVMFQSLRKVAIIVQTSHTTVARWLRNPDRKKYVRNSTTKASLIADTIRLAISNDPFISIQKMKSIVRDLFHFTVSSELLRTVIRKNGFTRKKARFFSKPNSLESLTTQFVAKRNSFISNNYNFVSLDETSFGRHGKNMMGYSRRGSQLRIQRKFDRITTISSLVIASKNQIIHREDSVGSFNTNKFCNFLSSLDLPLNTVILLDNVRFHHSKLAAEIAKRKQFILLFVPPYSPWFNPIEGIFSIVKRDFYKNGDIENAFKSVTQSHCSAFFGKSLSINV